MWMFSYLRLSSLIETRWELVHSMWDWESTQQQSFCKRETVFAIVSILMVGKWQSSVRAKWQPASRHPPTLTRLEKAYHFKSHCVLPRRHITCFCGYRTVFVFSIVIFCKIWVCLSHAIKINTIFASIRSIDSQSICNIYFFSYGLAWN